MRSRSRIQVRQTTPGDFEAIKALSRIIYPYDPWLDAHLESHRRVFPEGQLVAVDADGLVAGMAASLIVSWDDYDRLDSYDDFTDEGFFTNHDPSGRTLYGAEVMVDPTRRRQGIGRALYTAREALARRLGLLRIRAGARLPGFHRTDDDVSAQRYVLDVVHGRRRDPTLSFQLAHGFEVIAVVPGYYHVDRQSEGYAALIEWINPAVARPEDYARRNPRFLRPAAAQKTAGQAP